MPTKCLEEGASVWVYVTIYNIPKIFMYGNQKKKMVGCQLFGKNIDIGSEKDCMAYMVFSNISRVI